ncbi:DUF2589 domain-containing protein [Siphonobacter sp. SORGH_AS_1065]|uniref:DUF2589 domain-containing protein n=1 Tax=Siphonobacter sp. SORGH_AS_1065 TaxID=3041795 RepID=UPI00277E5845|nr:DUF2589 domain-containing protein [Siphonobacter sp. SORGH_AS_1065]MDQ1087510.1 hypothetical protein [Siphonobacter sp. SORGH_AS_1065]
MAEEESKPNKPKPAKEDTPSVQLSEEETLQKGLELANQTLDSITAREEVPLGAPSTNLTSELNNIDFRKMIGGPLQAVVDAQVASALATVNFINSVGFTETDQGKKELVMVDFTHTRKDVNSDGTPNDKEIHLKVPLLAILPIPSLRIEHAIIDFNVKLNSVETSSISDSIKVGVEAKGGWGPVSFKVSASYQRKSTTGVEVKKEYALNINVKAVQDEMPAGLEKILGMLAA